ncbi:MAG: hypothetical protein E7409_03320 [Ruminococcaceae bacterium]|nr:hypothetical protein [Oscillospiraceae bacterium]
MQVLSFVLSMLGLAAMVTASMVKGKNMKLILFLVCCGNLLVGASYHIGGSGINGAAACYAGGIMSICNYGFESRKKPIPMWLLGVYAVALIVLNLAVGGFHMLSILVIIAGMTFVMGIAQPNGAKYRFWTLANLLLWCLYDVLSRSFSVLPTHAIQVIFTVVGMIIYDRKRPAMPAGVEKAE